ncbi:twin-arginine translocase TatA/TatE family subunit [Sulfuriflexus mobilis]|uniref:twin-arginine translocase TatA/TatE family subunit n=1 Tax=Sulfuriflexus mobilis TaxID=1811807 RepID=UPI000F831C4C|nr:twin-arginine translocase TatA/TatE family subunit [Sulfuriflexus mobilis]
MGFGGIGVGSLILILVIVILLFGTKKLRNVGGDLGGALRSFRKSMKEGEDEETATLAKKDSDAIDAEVVKEDKEKDKG